MCGLMSCLVVCKFRKSMVIHDTECPYWDEVSLNSTNHTSRSYSSLLWVHDLGGWKLIQFLSTQAVPITSTTFSHHHKVPISALSSLTAGHLYWNITVRGSDLWSQDCDLKVWPLTRATGSNMSSTESMLITDDHVTISSGHLLQLEERNTCLNMIQLWSSTLK